MSCSKLIGKAILCVFLFSSFVVANNIVTTDAKQNTYSNAENDADFSNHGETAVLGTASPSTTKSSDDVLKSEDLSVSKDAPLFNKYHNNSNALSVSNTKNASDVIVRSFENSELVLGIGGGVLKTKDIDDVLSPKSDDGYISNTRTTLGSGLGIDGGILKSKDMNGYISNTRATLGNSLGIDGGILNAKDINSYIPNTRATEESMFGINGGVLNAKDMSGYIPNIQSMVGINDRTGHVIQTEGRPDCPDGYVADCSGDGDCCPESYIGDGYGDCEDQAWGCDLTCYGCDGGDCDCGDSSTTTTSGGGANLVASFNVTYDWYCSGSYGSTTVDFYDDYSAVFAGSYPGTWGYGNGATSFDDGLCSGGDLDVSYWFQFDNYATMYSWSQSGCGLHDDQSYNGSGNADGVTMLIDYVSDVSECYGGGDSSTTTTTTSGGGCPDGYVEDCSGDGDCCSESWIGDGYEDCEDQAFGCDLTCYDNDGGDCGPDCQDGDINCDGAIDVIDVVLMVNAIIAGDTLDGGDLNGDGSLDVIDVVILVNSIIDGRAMDADNATMIIADNSLRVSADGYIGGIQMTLSHSQGFELNLTDNAMVSEYKTTGTSTILVVVVPEDELIFTANQSFEVVDMIIANSEGEVEVNTVSEFGLSAAYPNPFNPSTTVTLTVPSADFVSVKVYNLVGQVVGVLAEGMMDANTYKFTWNASDMSSGVYMIRAESGSNVDIQKVLLVK